MNHLATFDNTVGILVKAYLEGTLLKGHCYACAVGNICAAALGKQVVGVVRSENSDAIDANWSGSGHYAMWRYVFMTRFGKQDCNEDAYESLAKQEIDATGYTWQQLARIEYAFETAGKGFNEAAEFAGLMAVVDVLADIHGVDLTTTTAAKALFVKA